MLSDLEIKAVPLIQKSMYIHFVKEKQGAAKQSFYNVDNLGTMKAFPTVLLIAKMQYVLCLMYIHLQ